MKALIFPALAGAMVVVNWVAIIYVDACLLGNTDGTFDCRSSLAIGTFYFALCAVATAIAAGISRAVLHRFLEFRSAWAECVAAILSSVLLVAVFSALVSFGISFGDMGKAYLGWLLASFAICSAALMIVNRFTASARGDGRS